jgi:hypothetical protein
MLMTSYCLRSMLSLILPIRPFFANYNAAMFNPLPVSLRVKTFMPPLLVDWLGGEVLSLFTFLTIDLFFFTFGVELSVILFVFIVTRLVLLLSLDCPPDDSVPKGGLLMLRILYEFLIYLMVY